LKEKPWENIFMCMHKKVMYMQKKVRPLSKIRQIKDHSLQAIIFLVSLRPNLHDFKKEPWHSMAQQSLAKVPQTIPFWNVHLLSH
jgi:hypothetical protein